MDKVARYIKKSTSQDSASECCSLSLSESSTEIQRRLSLSANRGSSYIYIAIFRANQLALTQETAKPFLDN